MKTLIYGAGPIGQWLALKLHQGDQDVTLLARGFTYRRLQREGIRIIDGFSGETKQAKVELTSSLESTDRYDLVIVPMPSSARRAVCPGLAENPHLENILFVGNDVAGPAGYLGWLDAEQVLLGFPGAGGDGKTERWSWRKGMRPAKKASSTSESWTASLGFGLGKSRRYLRHPN